LLMAIGLSLSSQSRAWGQNCAIQENILKAQIRLDQAVEAEKPQEVRAALDDLGLQATGCPLALLDSAALIAHYNRRGLMDISTARNAGASPPACIASPSQFCLYRISKRYADETDSPSVFGSAILGELGALMARMGKTSEARRMFERSEKEARSHEHLLARPWKLALVAELEAPHFPEQAAIVLTESMDALDPDLTYLMESLAAYYATAADISRMLGDLPLRDRLIQKADQASAANPDSIYMHLYRDRRAQALAGSSE